MPLDIQAVYRGHRATLQWQRERWAALPDVPYKGITFTMPDVLWPLFRDNPYLTAALSALAAKIIQIRVSTRSGLRVGRIGRCAALGFGLVDLGLPGVDGYAVARALRSVLAPEAPPAPTRPAPRVREIGRAHV